jgi:hypothetical protein
VHDHLGCAWLCAGDEVSRVRRPRPRGQKQHEACEKAC